MARACHSPGCPCPSCSSSIRIQADGRRGTGRMRKAGHLGLSAECDEKVWMLSGFLGQEALGSREASLMSVSHKTSWTPRASATFSVPGMWLLLALLCLPLHTCVAHNLSKHVNVSPDCFLIHFPYPFTTYYLHVAFKFFTHTICFGLSLMAKLHFHK